MDVAEAGLALHNLRTQIVKVHCDAVTRWDLIVQHARESTVVFNCIDYGAVMDMAINSLCKRLAIPYVSGSTYANTLIVNFFNGRQGQACWSCLNSVTESFIDNAMCKSDLEAYLRAEEDKKQQQQQQQKTTMTMTTATETHIISQTDRSSTKTDTRASAQAGEVHPGAASGSAATDAGAADVADAAAELYSNVSLNTLSGYLRDRCEMTEADAEIEAALRALQQKMSVNSNSNCKRKEQAHGRREGSTAAAVMVAGESGEKEGQKAEERGGQEEEKKGKREEVVLPSTSDLSALLKLLKVEISAKLLPSLILSYDNLNFIPKDLHFPTRNVGSWVCVCSGGALQMVNAWVRSSVGLFVCRSVCLCTCLPISLVCLHDCLSVCLCVCLPSESVCEVWGRHILPRNPLFFREGVYPFFLLPACLPACLPALCGHER